MLHTSAIFVVVVFIEAQTDDDDVDAHDGGVGGDDEKDKHDDKPYKSQQEAQDKDGGDVEQGL